MFLQGNHDDGPVRAGSQVMVAQDGRLLNFATDARLNVDYELEDARALGIYGPVDIKSMGSTSTLDMSTFLLKGQDEEGALALPGWQHDGSNNINRGGYYDFAFIDTEEYKILSTAMRFKLGSNNLTFPNRGFVTRETNWRGFKVLPGLHSS